MSTLTVPNSLPPNLIVLDQDVIEQKDLLIERAYGLRIASADDKDAADALAKEIARLFKGVEEQRLAFGRKLREITAQVNEASDEALKPLKMSWDDLVARIKAFVDAENEKIAAETKRLREEQERLQREEDARADAERERLQREAEMAAPPGEAPEEISVAEVLPQRIAPTRPIPKPLTSSAFRANGEPVLVIDREQDIPFEVNGIRLWKEPSKSAIKALLKSGITVPGCHLEAHDAVSMRGR